MKKRLLRKVLSVALTAAMILGTVPAFAAEPAGSEVESAVVSEKEAAAAGTEKEAEVIVPGRDATVTGSDGSARIFNNTAAINDVVIYSNGYAESTVYINADLPNPDDEYHTVYFRITEGEYAGQDLFVQEGNNYLDEKNYNYFIYVPTKNKTTKGKVVIVKGNHGEILVTESKELTLTPKKLEDFKKFEVKIKSKVTEADWDYVLEDSSTDDSFDFMFYYRKKGSGGEWQESGKLTNYYSTTTIYNLEEDTEYEYYAVAKIFYYNPTNSHNDALPSGELSFGSAANPKTFKTLKNKTYTAGDFEDLNFYNWLVKSYGGDDGDLTLEEMLKVTSINRSLTNMPKDFAPFTSIGGIENFNWLTDVNLAYNDLATIPGGDWLNNLDSLDLTGNLIDTIPDLSEFGGTSLFLTHNRLTEDVVKGKLPAKTDIESLLSNQQKDDDKWSVAAPPVYYPIGDKSPFFVYPDSYVNMDGVVLRGGRDYSMTATLDGKTIDSEVDEYYGDTVGNSYTGPWYIKDLNSRGLSIKNGDKKEIGIKVYCREFGKEKKEIYSGTVSAEFKSGDDFKYSLTNMREYKDENDPTDPYSNAPSIKIDGHMYAKSEWIAEYEAGTKYSFSDKYTNVKLLNSEGKEIELRVPDGYDKGYDFGANMSEGENRYDYYMFENPPMEEANDIRTIFIFVTMYPKEKLPEGRYSVSVDVEGGETVVIKDVIIVGKDGKQIDPDDDPNGDDPNKDDPSGGGGSENNGPSGPRVPVVEEGVFASDNDNFSVVAPGATNGIGGNIKKLVLDFSKVAGTGLGDKLAVTVAKGSKLTTDPGLKVVNFEADKKNVKVKLNKKTGVASVTPKKTGSVKFEMEDNNSYTVNFTVDSMKPIKSAKNIAVSDTPVTLEVKDLFDTSINCGELRITGGNSKSQGTLSENKLSITVSPKEKDGLKLQYAYLNKKYKTSLKIK